MMEKLHEMHIGGGSNDTRLYRRRGKEEGLRGEVEQEQYNLRKKGSENPERKKWE